MLLRCFLKVRQGTPTPLLDFLQRLTMRFNIGGIDLPVTIALHPCPDARARILTAMQGLCLTMDALRQSVSNLKEHARSLEVEAKDAEALVAAYVSTAEEAEHNLHESTAELLNKGITNGGAVAQQDSFNPDYVVGMVVEGEEGPSLGTTPGSPSGESSDSDGSLGRPDY